MRNARQAMRIFLTAVLLVIALPCDFCQPALACGAFDIGCEVRETVQNPAKKLGAIPGKVGSQWDTSRQDIHNGLDRVDPRLARMDRGTFAKPHQVRVPHGAKSDSVPLRSRNFLKAPGA
jgi:hypothetical protein